MNKAIKLNGKKINLIVKDLCHKGDFGNYKITLEKKITFDLKSMSEKLKKEYTIDKLHQLLSQQRKEYDTQTNFGQNLEKQLEYNLKFDKLRL